MVPGPEIKEEPTDADELMADSDSPGVDASGATSPSKKARVTPPGEGSKKVMQDLYERLTSNKLGIQP